ncbi:cilia- and flagella-associated protein 221 [Grus japonensis]|uniref:Cilia- and flagella-associated protein 221 n=1 Tax=Grus japonensis TaxID=30415 RepID=A0ABC9X0Z1_GRUJA
MDIVQSATTEIMIAKKSFKKIPSVLLGSLVEEPKKRHAVPSHLLESKIYSELEKSKVVQAEPAVLHYGGYKVGKHHQQTLKLINISGDVINLHIIPPQTKYFQIKYNKTHRLVPGLSYVVTVDFCPDEWRYYYDCIRIHCQGEDTLVIPVHAYPAVNVVEFPSFINLSDVSVGIIPGNGKVEVTVKYSPLEYGTAQMTMQLRISQFHSKPYEIEYQNLRFPTDLSNPYAVATVLNQEPGKLKIKDLKEAFCQGNEGIKTRQMKEAIFQLKVKQNIQEEEANHLKWQVHKGKDPISVEFKKEVIENRQREEEQYKAPDALGLVPIKPVDAKVRHILPFYDLKDELVQVVSSPEGQLNLVSQRVDFHKTSPEEAAERNISLLKLVPPQALVYPTESNPLRIFNPTPGLVPVLPPLAYSETNIEYHLCPHPKYTFTKECPQGSSIPVTQKKFLHHKCQKTLEVQTLSVLQKYEWDPYSLDMLPRDVPPMLCDLLERDRENIIDHETDETEFKMILTPEMVRAEFPQIGQALSEEGKEKSSKDDRDPHNHPDGHFQPQNNELREKVQKHMEKMKLKALNKTLILG